jgi:hypothetical protein
MASRSTLRTSSDLAEFHHDIPAYKTEVKGQVRIYLWSLPQVTAHPTTLSEITDAEGVVWIVDKVSSDTICYVTKKPTGKKPYQYSVALEDGSMPLFLV